MGEFEALGPAGVTLQQKKRAYGASKRKKLLKSKAVKRQKEPDTAAVSQDHNAPDMCKDQGKEHAEEAQHAEQAEQASLEV